MYSQHNEDEFLLKYIKDNRINVPKVIVEIGAWDAEERSNSRMFIQGGWRGYLIEPLEDQFYKIDKFYEYNFKVDVINCAIGSESGKGYFITNDELPDHAHLSDVRNENYDFIEEQNQPHLGDAKMIHVLTLPDLFQVILVKEIGILSIDIEGMDSVIAKQLINSEYRPTFIIIEGNNEKSTKRQQKILSKDYTMIKVKNVNTIWLYNGI